MTTIDAPATTVMQRIRDLRPLIEKHAGDGQELRRLPDEIADAFAEHRLMRFLLPSDLGGLGLDIVSHLDAVEEVSSYDGSVGWNFAIGTGSMIFLGFVPRHECELMLADRHATIAGGAAPTGRAIAVDGGYRVTGRWAWASGIHHSPTVLAGVLLFDGDKLRTDEKGRPLIRQVLLPKSECTVLDEWHVGGLRGTGSTEYTITDAFVPEVRVIGAFNTEVFNPAPFFHLPSTYFGVGLSAVCLGIARRAVEALVELAKTKRSMINLSGAMRDQPGTQHEIAQAMALVEAGRLYIHHTTRELWERTCRGDETTMDQRAESRRSQIFAAEAAAKAVDIAYRTAGGTALYERNVFERCLRDVHAALGHITLQRSMMEDVGRVMVGHEPYSPMF
jgi:alkylation response protein AidB-like acyl-CoA dehydrogenase